MANLVRNSFFCFIAFVVSAPAWAQVSASRRPGEDWRTAAARHAFRSNMGSAYDAAKPLAELDHSLEFPYGGQKKTLFAMFSYIRDKRFIPDPIDQKFLRRLSWLYPDDGCFMRAEWVARILNKHHNKRWVNKIFVFGNLEVKTPHHPNGKVTWWYHVVPGMGFGRKTVVLDPALNPQHPLYLEDWMRLMNKDVGSLKVAICRSGAFGPDSACENSFEEWPEDELIEISNGYLQLERARIKQLGRDPERELGNRPPWKQ